MKNPIPTKVRVWVYIAGLIISAICFVLNTVFEIKGLSEWSPVLVSITTAVGMLVSVLAGSHVTPNGIPVTRVRELLSPVGEEPTLEREVEYIGEHASEHVIDDDLKSEFTD